MLTIIQKDISRPSEYMLFDIRKLELNSYILFDIFIKKEDGFVIVVHSGTLLTQVMYQKLQKQNRLYIQTKNHTSKELNCASLQEYVSLNIGLNETVLNFLYKVQIKNYPSLLNDTYSENTTHCMKNIVHTLIYIIKEKKNFLKESMQYFSAEYKLEIHSLHVAIYAVNLAYILKFNDEELFQVGLSGLLHDIGVKTIDDDILLKNSKLDTKELQTIQKHPKESAIIAKHNHIHDPYIIDAIMHHHERYDGSGYPDKLLKNQIGKFAAILCICDTFDALTNNRPYRKKFTSFEALKFMLQDKTMIGKYNNKYLQVFLNSLI